MTQQYPTDDIKIREVKELLPPIAHLYELPISEEAAGWYTARGMKSPIWFTARTTACW